MTEMNLLPWRANKRQLENRQALLRLAALFLIGLGIIVVIHCYVNKLLDKQLHHNQQLKQAIFLFNLQIKKIEKIKKIQERFIAGITLIKALDLTRNLLRNLLIELTRVLPKDAYLSSVQNSSNRITLSGYALASKSVVRLIRNLEQSSLVKAPVLIAIKKEGENKMEKFTLSFILSAPNCAL